jgi:DNA ligase-1
MLAQTAADAADALARIHPANIEWKLDGVRLQVHVLNGEVRAFARTLADDTDRVPEIVDELSRLPVQAAILDGEASAPPGRTPAPVPGHGKPVREPSGRRPAASHDAALTLLLRLAPSRR